MEDSPFSSAASSSQDSQQQQQHSSSSPHMALQQRPQRGLPQPVLDEDPLSTAPSSPPARKPHGNSGASRRESALLKVANWKAGDLVWARLGKQPHYPGMIADPEAKEMTKRIPVRPDCLLVHFFGTHDYQYVPAFSTSAFEAGSLQQRARKSRAKIFLQAIDEVKKYLHDGTLPADWDEDRVEAVDTAVPLAREFFISRHIASEHLTKEMLAQLRINRIQHFNLIDEHHGFRPLSDPKLQHFSRYRRRREKQLKLMRFLALAPPEM